MAGMKWILQYSIGEKAMLKISGVVVDNEVFATQFTNIKSLLSSSLSTAFRL